MNNKTFGLEVTRELSEIMIALEHNSNFTRLMELMQMRAEGVSAWSCFVSDEVLGRWAQGRVQEMSDWLRAWNVRRDVRDAPVAGRAEF